MPVQRALVAFLLALGGALSVPPPTPDPALECALKQVLFDVAVARLPWLTAPSRVSDALRLSECPSAASRAQERPAKQRSRKAAEAAETVLWVCSQTGDDARFDGQSSSRPLRTLPAAQVAARAARAAHAAPVRVHLSGVFQLTAPLRLDSALDASTTWAAWPGAAPPVVSGGVYLSNLSWAPSTRFPAPVLEARLPEPVGLAAPLFSLFDGATGRRLPLAREPNGDPETQMQPTGYALCSGNVNGSLPPAGFSPVAEHVEVDTPARNSTVFPVWGRDFDPRNPGIGYVWFGSGGGAAAWMEGNQTFWANKTLPGGMTWNATGGLDHNGYLASPFNGTGWPAQARGRRAHVFHEDLWGSWVFDVAAVDPATQTMTFAAGGWQEGRGAWIGRQPFFVEGEAAALDSPAEWFIDTDTQTLHLWPNASATGPALVVAPLLETLVVISAPGVTLDGLSFQHTVDGLMEPYTVPEAGDWSVRRAAAVEVHSAAGTQLVGCEWRRVGGNGLLVTGASTDTTVHQCDFLLPGSSGVVVVGTPAGPANASSPGVAAAYPERVSITQSLFEGIGVLGKQSSALFVSVACNVTLDESVAFSGPRAGVNINDRFCGGHSITRSVLFDWVRETQDHGPINTWGRQMYVDPSDPSVAASPAWHRITNNAIFNGPSPNRDLGNLFPTVDNDDGSSHMWISGNCLIYGGGKNYLGSDKVWDSNLIVIPERWSGDSCLTAWSGKHHVYTNNTCVTPATSAPVYFDSSPSGATCEADYTNASQAPLLPFFARNTYYTYNGGYGVGCSGDITLADMQGLGQELGTVVRGPYKIADVVALARSLLA